MSRSIKRRTLAERIEIARQFRAAKPPVSQKTFCENYNIGKEKELRLKPQTMSHILSNIAEAQSQHASIPAEQQETRFFRKTNTITTKTAEYLLKSNELRGDDHSHVDVFRVQRAALRQVYYWTQVVDESQRIAKPPVIDSTFRTNLLKAYPELLKHNNPPCALQAQYTTDYLNTHKKLPQGISLEVRCIDKVVGYGLWTTKPITYGTKICSYDGPILPTSQQEDPMFDYEYFFTIEGTKYAIDAINGHSCFARYANDNFINQPNCVLLHEPTANKIWLQACTNIDAHTELTVRYTSEYWGNDIAANALPKRVREQVLKAYPQLIAVEPVEKKKRPQKRKRNEEEHEEEESFDFDDVLDADEP